MIAHEDGDGFPGWLQTDILTAAHEWNTSEKIFISSLPECSELGHKPCNFLEQQKSSLKLKGEHTRSVFNK